MRSSPVHPTPHDPGTTGGPRAHRDPRVVAQKLARLREPHVAPLTAFVERLRLAHGGGEAVPWFDPTEGGVAARILVLLEAPGPRATGAGGPRSASAGSGFVSSDNNDQTAANMWELLRDAGIDRRRDLATWNVVGWYVGDGSRIRAVNVRDMEEARASLHELVGLLPDLRVVVLLGKKAAEAWRRASLAPALPVLEAPHPSPLSLNGRQSRRQDILDALVTADRLARSAMGGGASESISATASIPPTAPTFSEKQGQYLAFIYAYTRVTGRPPAEADLQRHFRVTPPTVHQMVLGLESAGLIRRTPRAARSIEVLIAPEALPVLR